MKSGKRIKKARELVPKSQVSLVDAINVMHKYKQNAAKFDESVEVVFKLGVDPRQSNQMVRGSVLMPSGLGKTKRIAVFAQPERHKEALSAGADVVGFEELIEEIKNGRDDFDVCIATPDMMVKIGVLGKVLGTKGKMPNPKLGTVAADLTAGIQQAKKGMVEFRVEKGALVHAGVGKLSFANDDLVKNIKALYDAVVAAKPSESKGIYMQKMYLSSSQGPSVPVDVTSIATA
jgi:large subunit ribosomal protein L1